MKTIKRVNRYSEVFKRQVVKDVESGLFSVLEAMTVYSLPTSMTIYRWIRQYGYNERIGKVVHVTTNEEEMEVLTLRKEIAVLKQALEDSQIKNIVLETMIEVGKDQYGIDLKKKDWLQALSDAKAKLYQMGPESQSVASVQPSESVAKTSISVRKPLKRK